VGERVDAALGASIALVADVRRRRRVAANQYSGEAGWDAMLRAKARYRVTHFGANRLRRSFSVDDLRHVELNAMWRCMIRMPILAAPRKAFGTKSLNPQMTQIQRTFSGPDLRHLCHLWLTLFTLVLRESP
jgi:hypothetical protein